MQRLAVFCGSSPGTKPIYRQAARQLGQILVEQGIGLVYGGGRLGLMGTLADAVLEEAGEVIGVIPESLARLEVAHTGLTSLHTVESMHQRKSMIAQLCDGFIAMPGGIGTLEEYFEALTWTQLDIHQKPCGLLNVDHYYDELLSFLDRTADQGFVKQEHRDMVLAEDDPARLIVALKAFRPPQVDKAAWAFEMDDQKKP